MDENLFDSVPQDPSFDYYSQKRSNPFGKNKYKRFNRKKLNFDIYQSRFLDKISFEIEKQNHLLEHGNDTNSLFNQGQD
jgi:hypothetical protein